MDFVLLLAACFPLFSVLAAYVAIKFYLNDSRYRQTVVFISVLNAVPVILSIFLNKEFGEIVLMFFFGFFLSLLIYIGSIYSDAKEDFNSALKVLLVAVSINLLGGVSMLGNNIFPVFTEFDAGASSWLAGVILLTMIIPVISSVTTVSRMK